MSNPKFKNENYNNLGGINSKFSQYQTGPLEFLDIKNFDFQTPGSLTQRWGSTQYVSQSFGAPISVLYEYSKLDGSSYVIIGHTGGLWFGATTGNSQGMSFTSTGATTGALARLYRAYYGKVLDGSMSVTKDLLSIPYLGDTTIGKYVGSCTSAITPISNSANRLNFQTFNNYLYGADGTKFFKFDGLTTSPVGLFPPTVLDTTDAGANLNSTFIGLQGGTAGTVSFFASYVNQRGFESQIWPIGYISTTNSGATILGETQMIGASLTLYTPSMYGISYINIYSYYEPVAFGSITPNNLWFPNYVLLSKLAVQGETTLISLGTTTGGMSAMIHNIGSVPNRIVNSYFPLGLTLVSSSTQPIIAAGINLTSYHPRYLEVYSNRLFASGFSSTPSTVWFSGLAEPEGFASNANFEIRTNDSDFITCMKAYQTRLYIFKRESFHSLYGDSPENFYLQQVSTIYGCLNNDSAIVFENSLLFLDRKGVFMFNGSSIECLSDKMDQYFARMNYSAAVETAIMVHDKQRNQIMIGIPIDNSTTNNITLVYDYVAKSWTTYNGFIPTVFARIQGRNNLKNVFYGTPSGVVNWFGPSFLSDNGVGFTTSFKTRFVHDLGDSTQKQVRRLYIDADAGTTYSIPIKFYQDYGSSVVYSTTMTIGTFQNRIDFGISCKSIAFEIFNLQTNSPLRINGFTLESRLQRRV